MSGGRIPVIHHRCDTIAGWRWMLEPKNRTERRAMVETYAQQWTAHFKFLCILPLLGSSNVNIYDRWCSVCKRLQLTMLSINLFSYYQVGLRKIIKQHDLDYVYWVNPTIKNINALSQNSFVPHRMSSKYIKIKLSLIFLILC